MGMPPWRWFQRWLTLIQQCTSKLVTKHKVTFVRMKKLRKISQCVKWCLATCLLFNRIRWQQPQHTQMLLLQWPMRHKTTATIWIQWLCWNSYRSLSVLAPSHLLTPLMASKCLMFQWRAWTMILFPQKWLYVLQILMIAEVFHLRNSCLWMKPTRKIWLLCKQPLTKLTPILMMSSLLTNSQHSLRLLTHITEMMMSTRTTKVPMRCHRWRLHSTTLAESNTSKWQWTEWEKNLL